MASALFRPGDRPLLNLGLLTLTVATTFDAFLRGFGEGLEPAGQVTGALLFSVTLIAILGTHEMGHYVLARAHAVNASLPYFIPLPFLGVGTLGAVIRLRDRIPNRNALVDIGAAGPLAGLVVAIPLLAVGFAHSRVVDAPILSSSFPGEMSLWRIVPRLVHLLQGHLHSAWTGQPMPVEAEAPTAGYTVFGDSLLMLLIQRLVLGPLPAGKDVISHPMVVAGWFGLLVTMINLIPIGQLDGGHVTFAVLGRRARYVGWVAAAALAGLCLFVSAFWMVWLLVTSFAIGFQHPEVTVPEVPLTRGRKIISALCLLAFILCAMPVPLTMVTAP